MEIKYTNFDGDWDADCPFCGSPQRDHQVDNGELDGIRYIHRLPCPQERRHITKQAIIRANTIRAIVTVYDIVMYIWSRIPFKKEAALLFQIAKRTYVGLRGYLYFRRKYRKK